MHGTGTVLYSYLRNKDRYRTLVPTLTYECGVVAKRQVDISLASREPRGNNVSGAGRGQGPGPGPGVVLVYNPYRICKLRVLVAVDDEVPVATMPTMQVRQYE